MCVGAEAADCTVVDLNFMFAQYGFPFMKCTAIEDIALCCCLIQYCFPSSNLT